MTLLAFLVVVAVIILLLEPLVSARKPEGYPATGWLVRRGPAREDAPGDLDQLLRELSELEYDYRLDKVSPEDYRRLREDLLRRAAAALPEAKDAGDH